MLNKILIIIINSLFFTILIEVCLSLLLKIRNKKDIINIILINAVTNPYIVLFPYIIGLYYGNKYRNITLLLLEITTIIFEGYIYNKYLKYRRINPYQLSLILNIASYILGIFINIIIY